MRHHQKSPRTKQWAIMRGIIKIYYICLNDNNNNRFNQYRYKKNDIKYFRL